MYKSLQQTRPCDIWRSSEAYLHQTLRPCSERNGEWQETGACILDAEDLAGCLHVLHPLLRFRVVACQRLVQPGLILYGSPAQDLSILSSCAQALEAHKTLAALLQDLRRRR